MYIYFILSYKEYVSKIKDMDMATDRVTFYYKSEHRGAYDRISGLFASDDVTVTTTPDYMWTIITIEYFDPNEVGIFLREFEHGGFEVEDLFDASHFAVDKSSLYLYGYYIG